MTDYTPQRIVCLTEETTEMLYLLGEQQRIVGISGYTVRPANARKEKPRVCAFTTAKIDKILALKPDLVLGFSDLQADIASALIRQGLNVHIFNQRSIDEILTMIVTLGSLVGAQEKALLWVEKTNRKLAKLKTDVATRQAKENISLPVVYFEEWYDPIITGIQWVSEVINIAGGQECFPELSTQSLAKNRIIADPMAVVERKPDIIIGSWCGRKFRPETVYERPGWQQVPAVVNGHVFEIKSANILQPGPAVLTDGLDQVKSIIDNWYRQQIEKRLGVETIDG